MALPTKFRVFVSDEAWYLAGLAAARPTWGYIACRIIWANALNLRNQRIAE